MPETLDIKQEELDALLERVKSNNLQEGDYELIKALVETVSYLSTLSDAKAASIKRLLKMLFGDKTEKVKKKPTAQWEIIEKVADKIHPVYTALIRQAATPELANDARQRLALLQACLGDRMNLDPVYAPAARRRLHAGTDED